jgi:hypothetical protein
MMNGAKYTRKYMVLLGVRVMMTCFCESYYDLMKEFKGYR